MADLGTMLGASDVRTFLGLPSADDFGDLEGSVVVLGAPSATPYASVGPYCAGAPAAIRQAAKTYAGLALNMNFDLGAPLFAEDRINAVDFGDLKHDLEDSAANRALISRTIGRILDQGALPVVIGGDDSIPIPVLEAYAGRGPVTVLQIDAHIDWRDAVDGEPLGLSSTMRRASEMDHVSRIIQVGQRGIGSAGHQDWLDALGYGVEFVSGQQVSQSGIAAVLELIEPGSDVYVAFDCDALDPAIMPAVIGRTPGGMDYWQVVGLLQGVAAKSRIVGFDLVEFVPERDIDGMGALVASQILVNAIGLIARQQNNRRG